MSNDLQSGQASFADDSGETFLIRWRGRQVGPYTAAIIEAKLAANQIGLLHEISHNGRWITLRDYLAERDAILRAEHQAREEQERLAREEAERQAKEREEQRRAELLAEERRKNDLLQANIVERQSGDSFRQSQPVIRKPHRAGTILALGIIGLFVCGPLCLAAWVMGDGDLREMDAGIMDNSGRSTTATGRSLGVLGTVLWIIGVIVLFLI
jgi:hypothetical protein